MYSFVSISLTLFTIQTHMPDTMGGVCRFDSLIEPHHVVFAIHKSDSELVDADTTPPYDSDDVARTVSDATSAY
jgi:hypothetical protein